MSELRFDPIKGRWTIFAQARRMRPTEFAVPVADAPAAASPFTGERGTAGRGEILTLAHPARPGAGWQVKVVPDAFPVLRVEGDVGREGVGLYDRLSGIGAHEVIVENPDPRRELADLELEELVTVFQAFRSRLLDLRRDTRLRYVLIFKNKGVEAGATIAHPCCQLIATPIIPTVVVRELSAARSHYSRKERCIFCDVIHQELRLEERVAIETDRFIALEPFAAAFPFETWILPRQHAHDFALTSDEDLYGLAVILRDFLRRTRSLLQDPPYNLVLHTAPSPHPRPGQPDYWTTIQFDWHWHLEIVPRITRLAGFEQGSGYTINPTPPEEAARFLRDADPDRG